MVWWFVLLACLSVWTGDRHKLWFEFGVGVAGLRETRASGMLIDDARMERRVRVVDR